MRHCHGHVLLIPAALSVTACALYRTPILPERFEGRLSANADSLVASTQALYCAPTRHLDFGTTPQGCVRVAGDMRGWVNWTGTNRVVKVGRQWIQPDGVTALRVGRSMESELAGRLGPSVECHYPYNPTWHEVRWITTDSASISTVLRINDAADRTAPAYVVLIRTLGPEGCGYHNDRPWTH